MLYRESERKIAEEFVHRMVKRAVEMEGTVTVSRDAVVSEKKLTAICRANTGLGS